MAEQNKRSIALDILTALLKPLVRFCLRNSHSFQDFTRVAKAVFITTAEEELAKSGSKVNISRISVLTGLHRDDITRRTKSKHKETGESISVFGRVIGQWRQDKRFLNQDGTPRALSYSGKKNEFKNLCEAVSTAVNWSTILFELKRLDFVEIKDGKVYSIRQMFGFEGDPRRGYGLLARDIDSLMEAVEHNLRHPERFPNLHLRTEYDNLSLKAMPELKAWLIDEGKAFHKKVRDYISQFDKDINPAITYEEGGGFIALGTFSVSSEIPKDKEELLLKALRGEA